MFYIHFSVLGGDQQFPEPEHISFGLFSRYLLQVSLDLSYIQYQTSKCLLFIGLTKGHNGASKKV